MEGGLRTTPALQHRPGTAKVRPKVAFTDAATNRRNGRKAALGRTPGAGGIADEVAATPGRPISRKLFEKR